MLQPVQRVQAIGRETGEQEANFSPVGGIEQNFSLDAILGGGHGVAGGDSLTPPLFEEKNPRNSKKL